jgi:hypothetical protein
MTQQPDWAALAQPFPDEVIKQRPGRGSLTFSYVDARLVAQRLDDVLTPARWEFTCSPVGPGDVVHGRLTILLDSLEKVAREDFGYPNSDHDEEPLKAAASDALKRCAVQFGIGRHLYDDNKAQRPATRPQSAPHAPARAQAVPVATPRPVAPVTPPSVEPDWMADAMELRAQSMPTDKTMGRPAAAVPTSAEFERQTGVKVAVDNPPLGLRKLFDAFDAKGIDKRYAASVSQQMFGTGMLKDLTDAQRGDLWAEVSG